MFWAFDISFYYYMYFMSVNVVAASYPGLPRTRKSTESAFCSFLGFFRVRGRPGYEARFSACDCRDTVRIK